MNFWEAMLNDTQLDQFSQWSHKDLHIEGLIYHIPNLMMSLEIDGQTERMSQTLEDMLMGK